MDERRRLAAAALAAAVEAGREVLAVYETDFDVQLKGDRSPLTLADQRSQASIHAALRRAAPGIPFLGEEGRQIPYSERSAWDRFWLVDPLDGTKEFVKRNGEFTINIALIEGARASLGVVYVPLKGFAYFAADEEGAFALSGAQGLGEITPDAAGWESARRGATTLPSARADVFTVAASRSHMTQETEAYISRCRRQYGEVRVRTSGSSLKLCHVAEGLADVYPRFGPTSEWDVAAGQAVVEHAGGVVINVDTGEPLAYNKASLLNPWFLCVAGRYVGQVPAV